MSSMTVMNRVASFFPEGIMLDQSGNCFNLFMEFPTIDGRMAGVLIWEESVNMYYKEGSILSKKEYFLVNQADDEDLMEEFRQHEMVIFSNDNISFSDDDEDEENPLFSADPYNIFDINTMIAIGKTWCKYNKCLSKALRGE